MIPPKKVFAYQPVGFLSQKKKKNQMVSPQNGDTRGGPPPLATPLFMPSLPTLSGGFGEVELLRLLLLSQPRLPLFQHRLQHLGAHRDVHHSVHIARDRSVLLNKATVKNRDHNHLNRKVKILLLKLNSD